MKLWMRLRLSRQPDGPSLWWGIAILLAGIVLVFLGWFWEGTWEDVFIEVGAAAGVGGIVLLFKPRLMRQVDERATEAATTTAEDIASAKTEAIEKRLIKLESISDIQDTERGRFEQETTGISATVGDDASFASVNGLLDHASKLRLFAETFLVKFSTEPGQPLFDTSQRTYKTKTKTETIQAICFGIVALTHSDFESEHYSQLNHTVHWTSDSDVEEFIGRVYSGLTRANAPLDKFSLETLILNLQESHRFMMAARKAPLGSGKRLSGKLMLLINDEWVVTDAGLEATQLGRLYRWCENPPHGNYIIDLYDATCPPNCQQALWEEAGYYASRLRKRVESEPF